MYHTKVNFQLISKAIQSSYTTLESYGGLTDECKVQLEKAEKNLNKALTFHLQKAK